jgi:hypothetical protein
LKKSLLKKFENITNCRRGGEGRGGEGRGGEGGRENFMPNLTESTEMLINNKKK